MKKKINRQLNGFKIDSVSNKGCMFCKAVLSKKKNDFLFHKNNQLIASTVNDAMYRATFLSTINKIILRQSSKQSIFYQEIQKNLISQQYLQQYFSIKKIPNKISQLVSQNLPNVKASYMDFKLKNFEILNKYRSVQRINLPYPLCTKFQKVTDSKMSSTKSVENKILQQLEKQTKQQGKKSYHKKEFNKKNLDQRYKKSYRSQKLTTQNFQIKTLAKNIQEMIQNIKDIRALENFKHQIKKTAQFKYPIEKYMHDFTNLNQKDKQIRRKINSPKRQNQNNYCNQKQFKTNIKDDMKNNLLNLRKMNSIKSIKKSTHLNNEFNLNKKNSKNKLSFKSADRIHTNLDTEFEEYGLSVIKEKRKKSRPAKKSKSRQKSKKSKQNETDLQFSNNRRLQTEYYDCSSLRLNTDYSSIWKQKASSRMPTQYDSELIMKKKKQRSKGKVWRLNSSSNQRKQVRLNQASSKNLNFEYVIKKSKSKSNLKLVQLKSPKKSSNK